MGGFAGARGDLHGVETLETMGAGSWMGQIWTAIAAISPLRRARYVHREGIASEGRLQRTFPEGSVPSSEFPVHRAQILLNACHGTTDPRRMDSPPEAEIVDPVGTHGMDSLAGEVRLRPAADPVGVGRLCRGGPRDRGGVLRRGEARPGDGHGRR